MQKNKYVIYNLDYEQVAECDTLKEAKAKIRDLKRFDKENENPFNENYTIEIEEQ